MRCLTLGLCVLIPLSGCTVMEMRKDVQQREVRIESKAAQLKEADQQHDALKQRQVALVSDLNSRQMTLEDLQARLDQLQAQNRRVAASSDEQKARQRDIDRQIALQKQEVERQKLDIARLEKTNAISDEKKRERIQALKNEIRKQLRTRSVAKRTCASGRIRVVHGKPPTSVMYGAAQKYPGTTDRLVGADLYGPGRAHGCLQSRTRTRGCERIARAGRHLS